jgi:hypothetical protein
MFKLDDILSGVIRLFSKDATYVNMAIVIMAPSKTSMNLLSIKYGAQTVGGAGLTEVDLGTNDFAVPAIRELNCTVNRPDEDDHRADAQADHHLPQFPLQFLPFLAARRSRDGHMGGGPDGLVLDEPEEELCGEAGVRGNGHELEHDSTEPAWCSVKDRTRYQYSANVHDVTS